MKKIRILSLLLVLALVAGLLCGCGASSSGIKNGAVLQEMAAADAAPMEEPGAGALLNTAEAAGTQLPEGRKWIVTIRICAETEDLDTVTAALNEAIEALQGYVEDQNIHNGSTRSTRRYRSASLTVRIPAEKAEEFTTQVSGLTNVVSQEKSTEDITLSYVATESRMKALETEEARLLELLAQAENMSDLLEIEGRLTEVRYELERITSQLRLYDNRIDYATIYLTLEEVQEYTPVAEPTLWQRISGGFITSLKGLGSGILDLLVWVIAFSPYLVAWGAVIAALVLVVTRIRKNRKAKKNKTP